MSTRFGTLRGVRPAGGGRTNTWAVLDSDSENEMVPKTPISTPNKKSAISSIAAPKKASRTEDPIMEDAILQQMLRGELNWGDLLCPVDAESTTPPPESVNRGSEGEFWSAPWGTKIHELTPDVYDTSALSDVEYNAMMSWLYWNGWWVGDFERSWVPFEPDNMPARRWCPPADTPTGPVKVVHFGCSHAGHHHKKEKKSDSTAPILRFCRATECTEEGCRYIHGDTIPRVDRQCAFGSTCGGGDATGLKRSQCLYMHPGETWTADIVIRRPVITI